MTEQPRYFKRRPLRSEGLYDNNPLTGVANLFDLGLVFIAVLVAYRLEDLMKEDSNMTVTRQNSDGTMDIVVKQGKKIEAMRVTAEPSQGKGQRLGVAYRLADGSLVYVPDADSR